ncbi:MAG: isochorismatase family cysteine hydrolase [Planifilum fimeticola]|jgi:nicotinamidase-related amidase
MERRERFFNHVERQLAALPAETVSSLIDQSGGPERVVLVFVDILKGFCEKGPLASERVAGMVAPVKDLAEALLKRGVPDGNLVFLNDAHPEDAVEFSAFPPHCVRGTAEAEVVDELQPLLERGGVRVFRKNATNGLFGKDEGGERFYEYLEKRFAEGPVTFIVVGDCTDLCIYQNAMGIRLLANEHNARVRVIVPLEHVRTYDVPVEVSEKTGAPAHDGDVMDQLFAYHMMINGIEVVRTVEDR